MCFGNGKCFVCGGSGVIITTSNPQPAGGACHICGGDGRCTVCGGVAVITLTAEITKRSNATAATETVIASIAMEPAKNSGTGHQRDLYWKRGKQHFGVKDGFDSVRL
jgi:hypothetical protein